MPFVYDPSNEVWSDDNTEPPAPSLAAFEYVTAPDWRGDGAGAEHAVPFSLDQTPTPGRWQDAEVVAATWERFVAFIKALKGFGAVRLYVRYDGGNDEGRTWLDHVVLASGEKVERAAALARLTDAGVGQNHAFDRLNLPKADQIAFAIDFELCQVALERVLTHFGTGEYVGFGALIIDLEAMTITDDPAATPVIRNIEIAGVEPQRG